MNKQGMRQRILIFVTVATAILAILFLLTSTWIGYEVKETCKKASFRYGEDCVTSLQKLVLDEKEPYGERNSAIWTLGQIGDESAISTLESLYTGQIPDREPWNETLSQYELSKAIKLLKGGVNISAFVWR